MTTTSPKSKSPAAGSPEPTRVDQEPEGIIEAGAPGEADDGDDFDTTDYAGSTASTSVHSSVNQHSYENGRRVSILDAEADRAAHRMSHR